MYFSTYIYTLYIYGWLILTPALYPKAIRKAVQKAGVRRVLDIGSGTGLLSMFAALAWNSGHMWLPLYSESCPALDAPVRYGSDRRQTASSVAACTNVQRCRGPCEINLELDRVLPRGRVELWVPHRPRRCPRHRTQRDGAPRGRARSTCTAHAGGMRCRRGRSKPGTRSGPPRGLAY